MVAVFGFSSFPLSRMALRPITSYLKINEDFSSGNKGGWSVKLTKHLHLVTRLRMYEALQLPSVFSLMNAAQHRDSLAKNKNKCEISVDPHHS